MSQSGLGAALRRAREEQGLTLEDAERDTRISKRYLEALEDERFDVVPAPVYARGFLRSYSQYLGLDPNEVLSLYPREDDQPQKNQRGRSSSPPPREAPAEPPRESQQERYLPFEDDQYPPRMRDPREPTRRQPQPLRPATLNHRDGLADERRQAYMWIGIAGAAIIAVALIAFFITNSGDDDDSGAGAITTTPELTSTSTEPADTSTVSGGATEPAATEPPATGTAGETPAGTVPNLIGQTGAAAKETLTGLGLTWQIIPDPADTDEDSGIVSDHIPNPGDPIEPGGTVTMIVVPAQQ